MSAAYFVADGAAVDASVHGALIKLEVPSGNDVITLYLEGDAGLRLTAQVLRARQDRHRAIDESNARVVAFKSKRRTGAAS